MLRRSSIRTISASLPSTGLVHRVNPDDTSDTGWRGPAQLRFKAAKKGQCCEVAMRHRRAQWVASSRMEPVGSIGAEGHCSFSAFNPDLKIKKQSIKQGRLRECAPAPSTAPAVLTEQKIADDSPPSDPPAWCTHREASSTVIITDDGEPGVLTWMQASVKRCRPTKVGAVNNGQMIITMACGKLSVMCGE